MPNDVEIDSDTYLRVYVPQLNDALRSLCPMTLGHLKSWYSEDDKRNVTTIFLNVLRSESRICVGTWMLIEGRPMMH